MQGSWLLAPATAGARERRAVGNARGAGGNARGAGGNARGMGETGENEGETGENEGDTLQNEGDTLQNRGDTRRVSACFGPSWSARKEIATHREGPRSLISSRWGIPRIVPAG